MLHSVSYMLHKYSSWRWCAMLFKVVRLYINDLFGDRFDMHHGDLAKAHPKVALPNEDLLRVYKSQPRTRAATMAGWWLTGWPIPLKNDGVRQLGWWHSQYMEIHLKNVPNHQPDGFTHKMNLKHSSYHSLLEFTQEFSSVLRIPMTWFHSMLSGKIYRKLQTTGAKPLWFPMVSSGFLWFPMAWFPMISSEKPIHFDKSKPCFFFQSSQPRDPATLTLW